MICPECKCEYIAGATKCSDCGVDLIDTPLREKVHRNMSVDRILLLKYGINLLFVVIFQIILVVIAYEFYWVYRLNSGGVGGSAIEQIHPLIWFLLSIESIISVAMISWGASKR